MSEPPRLLTTRALELTLQLHEWPVVRLIPPCHRAAGVDVLYQRGGMLLIQCHRCHQEVARLAVAGGQPRGMEETP